MMRFFVLLLITSLFALADSGSSWRWYLGDLERTHYSPLDQINKTNVAQLEQVWVYRSGGEAQIQCNPIIVNGLLYGVSAQRHIFALNAATGKEVWKFDPADQQAAASVLRGVQYWESGRDKRIMAALGHYVYALDARTGKRIVEFGDNGAINLKDHYDRDVSKLSLGATTPGAIYKDIMIMSVRVQESHPAVPGDIMAFNVRTGEKVWVFHTIPRPGEFGHETWPADAWKTAGGANCWGGMSVDEKRGVVYIPTGSAAYDFYGADRHGENLFANCVLALKAETGERIWHYQIVRHDLWDRDLPAPPNLVTVVHDGKKRDAVAQITKSGYVFVLDRDTGEPLFPMEEVPAPPSDLPGEVAWPSQPLPLKPPPFARQTFPLEEVTTRTPEAHAEALERRKRLRWDGPFTPPTLEGTLIMPSFDGGGEWGGAAVNPKTGIMYVNASEIPCIVSMFDASDGASKADSHGKRIYSQNCVFCHGVDMKGDPIRVFPPLKDLQKKYTMEQMAQQIKNGKERMPAFGYLSQADMDAVLKYICGLEDAAAKREGTEQPAQAPSATDGKPWFNHSGYTRFVDKDGYPAITPPWGTLTAIDLNKGEHVWQVPLGFNPELADAGLTNTGTENYGGPVVTASGLIFIAASKDAHLRAIDERTGKTLWQGKLPFAGYATPSTYMIKGRQYVVIAAAGGKLGTPSGDAYVAFALPR
ncbi:MAG TPA: PQQ-binding-like beta-propeller repeat protein [Candidatus Hydrogenedentes bacterium]|nr:PQQ-binding-like beta-propeller repeat protein [Candidatus Hydrogenedentota bacterium]